jgi:regulator of sirC expression with transglutaminase-like and TPR domain
MEVQPLSLLDYFEMLVADDAQFALTEAAVAIAQDEYPRLDTQAVLAEIDVIADRLRQRIPADCAPTQRLRLLQRYFHTELGFGGNVNDYYSPRNSYLIDVLRTRRGIPISLAVIYLEVARQVGLSMEGVSFPGHFLVKLKVPGGEVVIDPLDGRSLSRDELEERLGPYRRHAGLVGDVDMPLALFLRPAPPREVIARMLRNLQEVHRRNVDWTRLLAVQERLVRLLPLDWSVRRDRGLTLAELGRKREAIDDLQAYVQHARGAADLEEIEQQLADLRAAGPTLWH